MKWSFTIPVFLLVCIAHPVWMRGYSIPHQHYEPQHPEQDACSQEEKNICKVSGNSLNSAIRVFFCKTEEFCSTMTEADKKKFLAEDIAPFLDIDVNDLSKMDSCRLVPLFNLVKYHITHGHHVCVKSEEGWRKKIMDHLAKESPRPSLYRLVTPELTEADRLMNLRSANNMLLVSLGCINLNHEMAAAGGERQGYMFSWLAKTMKIGKVFHIKGKVSPDSLADVKASADNLADLKVGIASAVSVADSKIGKGIADSVSEQSETETEEF